MPDFNKALKSLDYYNATFFEKKSTVIQQISGIENLIGRPSSSTTIAANKGPAKGPNLGPVVVGGGPDPFGPGGPTVILPKGDAGCSQNRFPESMCRDECAKIGQCYPEGSGDCPAISDGQGDCKPFPPCKWCGDIIVLPPADAI